MGNIIFKVKTAMAGFDNIWENGLPWATFKCFIWSHWSKGYPYTTIEEEFTREVARLDYLEK